MAVSTVTASPKVPPPRADGLLPVRFLGTWDLTVRVRVFNAAANAGTQAPYRIELRASARDWSVTHDTGYIAAVGAEYEYSQFVSHTWCNYTLGPDDPLTITLVRLSRESSSFWPDFNMQLSRIRLRLNTSAFEPDGSGQFSSWLYGDEWSPSPPAPPLLGRVAGG